MRDGDRLSKDMQAWLDKVEQKKSIYKKQHDSEPDAMTMSQDRYMELCAALGCLVKQIRGLTIIVNWGEISCSSK